MPLSTKLWEKKGRSSPHCLKLPMLLPRKAACSQQPSTVHSRALRLCHQQKENILSSSCLSAVACPLTTCGQGKLSTFISCSKLESPIWIYQMTANSFKLSFQDHFPTFDPFWQLIACRIPVQWGMTLWGKPVLLKGIAETFWDASTMATIVITSFCCERQPSKEDKEMDYPQNTKLGFFVSWGWCGQAADRTLVVLESTWEVWNRQWEKYTKSTNQMIKITKTYWTIHTVVKSKDSGVRLSLPLTICGILGNFLNLSGPQCLHLKLRVITELII